jgi:chromosome segregation ATPase
MDLSQEQRKAYMQLYTKNEGRENNKHELPAEDVLRVLRTVAGKFDQAVADGVFQSRGRGKALWTKPEYLSAIHVLQTTRQSADVQAASKDLMPALRAEVSLIKHAHQTITSAIQQKQVSISQLKQELASLQAANRSFDAQYVVNAQKLSALRIMVSDMEKSASLIPSPRSDSAITKLNSLEESLGSLEQQIFGLVPFIEKPDTKTKLSVLAGRCEELQAKHVDAIQALGLASQGIVSARRRSLVKRLDTLSTLGRTLHKIANDS